MNKSLCIAVITLLLMQGCSVRVGKKFALSPSSSPIAQQLHAHYQEWEGTPYRLGGVTTNGVDCSGFVYRAYRDRFNLLLPRTTINQIRAGYRVSKAELSIGDLVFFKTSYKTRHVGIYVGKGKFMHASSSQGVTISHLSNPYWKKHYWFAKHIPELDTL